MSNRSLCRAFAQLLLVVGLVTVSATAVIADQPNVILIMADDMGWGDPGFNGGTRASTPCLDEMAEAGMRLSRFYAAAPVCSPTRGSCLTGRHPTRYGIPYANDGHMLPEEILINELLHDQGYATGHFGKWHLGTLTTEFRDSNRGAPGNTADFSPPWENGFDVSFSTEAKVPTWDPYWAPSSRAGKFWAPMADPTSGTRYGTRYYDNGEVVPHERLQGCDSRIIADAALEFIRTQAEAEKPFCTVIWFHAPHLPVSASEQYTSQFADLPPFARQYFGCIAALDEQVGRVRSELRELGIAEDTIVFYCSDNGPEGSRTSPGSAGHFRGRKRDLLEGGIRVPSLWEWPGHVPAGSTSDAVSCTSDYLPTVLDLLDLPYGSDRPLDGISLAPLMEDTEWRRPSGVGFSSQGSVAWIEQQYKIIRERNDFALYDITTDEREANDLSADHPEIVAQLRERFEAWETSCSESNEGNDYEN